ncbi:MAG TPA: hypothetical protein VF475_10735 [Sphingobium sp.]
MAFKTLKTKREAISLTALGEEIAERRIIVGDVNLPRNVGTRRTASKAALLEQIAKAGGNW